MDELEAIVQACEESDEELLQYESEEGIKEFFRKLNAGWYVNAAGKLVPGVGCVEDIRRLAARPDHSDGSHRWPDLGPSPSGVCSAHRISEADPSCETCFPPEHSDGQVAP